MSIKTDSKNKIIYTRNLGEGGFGTLQLYKCKQYCNNYNCNKCIVVKTMKENLDFKNNRERLINHFYNEFYITINLNHPNIRKTLDIDEKTHSIMFEYCPGIDLFDYINEYTKNTKFLLPLYSQILDGVEYLHNNDIAHLDLKLENIMIYNNHIKIIDFGEALRYRNNGKEIPYKGAHGTVSYMPPEMIQKKIYKPDKVDIWSCGILLYNIIRPYMPWELADSKLDKLYSKFKYSLENYNTLDPCIFTPLDNTYSANEKKIIMTIFKYTFQINPDLRKSISMLKNIFNLIEWETTTTNNTLQEQTISNYISYISYKSTTSISN